ncbi:MAG: desulfoferrodoxin [Candidatus Paceibacterota bacterium]|nr:desulfoferrodoxin [Candidatus Paceibacterota bacterium]MDD4830741.1 desulfoferrodoxin [Candidatus Paceibacterota bacterium]MDD4874839.1 desulfoferrodoxin [Candidatus Paceibacterota bacterium]
MSLVNQLYRCKHCKNVVEVVYGGDGYPVCCEENMDLLKPKDHNDNGFIKHVPVIQKKKEGILVTVGQIIHPMDGDHYIEWIELIADGRVYRKYLTPDENPEAIFNLVADKVEARVYCNIHGLWHNIT